ncbi:bestrophin-like domain [Streptomyces sp. IBSNAI002]|uniref:bestrophin-like domain n=1 Tax=Streptomyces sp. IBSNAI002 TaxID=3457500 RepID=UPI003FD2FEC5
MTTLMFQWVYVLPIWLMPIVFVGAFAAFGAAGLWAGRSLARRLFGEERHWAEVISLTLHLATIFYSLLLALLAVAAYEGYSETQRAVSREAATLGVLYRDISGFPEPVRSNLQEELRDYTRYVVDEAWPQQQRGIVPREGVARTTEFQNTLLTYRPTEGERALTEATIAQFNEFADARRARLDAVTDRLPDLLWAVLTVGILISIALVWFLPVESVKAHLFLAVAYALLSSLVLALVVAMDNPFRGAFSVSSEDFELLLRTLMAPNFQQ